MEQAEDGLTPMELSYDEKGRLSAINQDSQRWVYAYDVARRVTDADGKSKRHDYDVAGRFNTLDQQDGNRYVNTFNEAGKLSDVSTGEATSILCAMMGPSG